MSRKRHEAEYFQSEQYLSSILQPQKSYKKRGNNTPETDAVGQESVAAVVASLSNQTFFPWVECIDETEAWSREDCEEKTDLFVYIDSRLFYPGMLDTYRVQVKSSWNDLNVLRGSKCKEVFELTDKKWREMGLVVLFGQMSEEIIAASFILQIMNHLQIYGDGNKEMVFMQQQTAALQTAYSHLLSLDLPARDWDPLLSWVRGRQSRTETGNGSVVKFY